LFHFVSFLFHFVSFCFFLFHFCFILFHFFSFFFHFFFIFVSFCFIFRAAAGDPNSPFVVHDKELVYVFEFFVPNKLVWLKLIKSATPGHFWEKVPSLLRTRTRTRIRICCQNKHARISMVLPRWRHVEQSGDHICQFLPRGMPTRP
jgi:hypothetical protein